MARTLEPLVPEVLWSNRQNSGSGDRHQIGIFAHCIASTASTNGQTTKIVALAIANKSVSPTIIPPSIKYFDVLFWGYALDIYYLLLVSVWIMSMFERFAFQPLFFLDQCLVHCSWDINGTSRHMNSVF